MTTPDVDHELERLFAVGRAATVADVDARERIRAALAPRLASNATTPQPASAQRLRLGIGLAVLSVCAVAVWLARAPGAKNVAPAVSALASAPATAVVEPIPSTAPAPQAAPAPVDWPPVSAKPPPPALQAAKPAPSSTHDADPAAEPTLVRAMQQALRSGNPSQALALAADHARRFPHGTLLEEREGVRAVAQCQLAAPGARGAILDAFAHRFATSPYAARVKAACQ